MGSRRRSAAHLFCILWEYGTIVFQRWLFVIELLVELFNKRCGSILEVNALLASHKLPTLKTSGSLE